MKFTFWTTETHSYLEAEFDEDDSLTGKREEGSGVEITFQNKVLVFDYPVKNIHPDILGLICLANFFPFIGKRVEFPVPVSPRLEQAFKRQPFVAKKTFDFVNVDNSIEKYQANKIAIAYGGGVDSTAVHEMFPEAYVVHEAHIKNDELVPAATHSIIKAMDPERAFLVTTNQRYVSLPGGWHSWPCSTVCSLLMATDKDIGLILTGTVLGSNWLWNGTKYYDRIASRKFQGASGNYWQSVFADIGIPMFSPIDGISEFGSMRLSLSRLNKGEVNYCTAGKDGNHCEKCSKCLRKSIERKLCDPSYEPNWDNYNTLFVIKFLSKRPLYFGHIFKFAAKQKILPEWMNKLINKDTPEINTEWPLKYYPPALLFCPEPWQEVLKERITSHFDLMEENEIAEIESWNQTIIKPSFYGLIAATCKGIFNKFK